MTTTKSEIPTAYEFDGETGQANIRELTEDEINQIKSDAAQLKKQQAQVDAKIAARQSALGKLTALGLTKEEIDAL
jgi:hypothetical protein